MQLGHFKNDFVKNKIKKSPTGKNFGVFSTRYSQKYILNRKFNPNMDKIRAFFQDKGTFYDLQKRAAGEALPLPLSCVPALNVFFVIFVYSEFELKFTAPN